MYATSTITTADFTAFLATCDKQLASATNYLFQHYAYTEGKPEVAVMTKLIANAQNDRNININQAAKLGYDVR